MAVYKPKTSKTYWCDFQVSGQRVCLNTGELKKSLAKAFEAEQKKLAKATSKDGVKTLGDLYNGYLKTQAPNLEPMWARTVGVYLERMLFFVGPNKLFSEITTGDYAAFLDEQAATPTQYGRFPANNTINNILAAVRQVHLYAEDVLELKSNPIKWKLLKRKRPRERIRFLMPEEARRIYDELPRHIGQLFVMALATGCRLEELEALEWSSVRNNQLYIPVSKGGDPREVPLNESARRVLADAKSDSDYVFDVTNRRKYWEAARERCGLKDFRWHDLRHTAATWLAMEGVPLQVIQQILGHKDIKTTMRYLHAVPDQVKREMERMPSILENPQIKPHINELDNSADCALSSLKSLKSHGYSMAPPEGIEPSPLDPQSKGYVNYDLEVEFDVKSKHMESQVDLEEFIANYSDRTEGS